MIAPDLDTNPKKFWGFIKSKRKDAYGVSPLKGQDGGTYSDAKSKANILNSQFSSVFNKNEPGNIPDKGPSPHKSMDKITVSVKGVFKLLINIKPHKATGPDNIPGRLLKELANELAPVLTTLYQASLDQVQFRTTGGMH